MYKFADNFLFRTPYYPFSALSDFKTKIQEPVFKEMLQIATPDLSTEMDKKYTDRILLSACLYYQRACTRPTPFGLFAGCSIGSIAEKTEIQLLGQKEYKRVTRLDMNYICALIQQIEKNRDIRKRLHYYPNTSIYRIGNNFRYVEYYYRKTHRVYQLTQIEYSKYLQMVFSVAKKGVLFTELLTMLIDDEITEVEAEEFIHELIDAQVLISDLEPAVTNVQPLATLIEKLKELLIPNKEIVEILSKIAKQLMDIDRQPIGDTTNLYPDIITNIEKTKVASDIKYLFQTDMFKPVLCATISRKMIQDIQQTLVFLNKISRFASRTNLSKFIESFVNRYDSQEIPLLFALDSDLGIGYAGNSGDVCPLIDDLILPRKNNQSSISVSYFQVVLLQKYQQMIVAGKELIELIDEDVKGVDAVWDDLPYSISVICQVLQDDDMQHSVYIKAVGGPSATILLGRFCHLDEKILEHTLSIIQKEELLQTDSIYAEIVHLPESRTGNILLRPVLRPYEIPYLAKSGVFEEFELSLDDLYISVKNNRAILRSKRLNKEIIPRMSTAHNYGGQGSMSIYHFLCDIQHQNGRTGLGFHWGDIAQCFDYLPRVNYKNCILYRARWRVRGKEVEALVSIKNDSELLLRVKNWLHERNIPDIILLIEGDNELYVDFNNPLSIRAWLSVVKKHSSFYLEEFLFDPTTAVVHGQEGDFTNEFIFAFYKELAIKK